METKALGTLPLKYLLLIFEDLQRDAIKEGMYV